MAILKKEHIKEADAIKKIKVQRIKGLPSDIKLDFSSVHIRFYKSQDQGFFSCQLSIPGFEDNEGYALDLDFSSCDNQDEGKLGDYDCPFSEHSIETLSDSVVCKFEDKTEMGQRFCSLIMKINGTPFNGHVFIDDYMYSYL